MTDTALSPDKILTLEAGPELDALVAEKVMGAKRCVEAWRFPQPRGINGSTVALFDGWHPSTDHNHAMEVAEKAFLAWQMDCDHRDSQDTFSVTVVATGSPSYAHQTVYAKTLPLAICQAALRAVVRYETTTKSTP